MQSPFQVSKLSLRVVLSLFCFLRKVISKNLPLNAIFADIQQKFDSHTTLAPYMLNDWF